MLSGKDGVRWLCPMCENEDIVYYESTRVFECSECNHAFSRNSLIILGKRSRVKSVRDFVREMLDAGKDARNMLRSQWNKSPTFNLYFRAGVIPRIIEVDGERVSNVCRDAVISNVTSLDPGIGNYGRLLAFVEREARARDYDCLTIENPQEEHLGIYERRGFIPVRYEGILVKCVKELKEN